jgi:integrase
MASVRHKPNSRYWYACFTDSNGVQRQCSTKETSRTKAQRMAEKFEAAYRLKLTEAQARKVVSDIYEVIHGEVLFHATVRKYLEDWLASKKAETAAGSYKRYGNAVTKLLKHLGDRADKDIAYVHKNDLLALRDKTASELSPSTANTDLKILRIAFRQAVVDGLRIDNPAAAVKTLKERKPDDAPERRPFTELELQALLDIAKGEWKGLILAGLYTGQRLGDLASMRWRMVDLRERTITFQTHKTNRTVLIPIAAPLLSYLSGIESRDPNSPVFPDSNQERQDADGESRRLSAQFRDLLAKAHLTSARSKKSTGRGRSVRRMTSELSFHSLRHTATSWLKKAGVPESVVMDIIGHESDLISRNYTHVDDGSKRDALQRLPVFN